MDISINNDTTSGNRLLGKLGAFWGFIGAFALIAYAVWRLTPLWIEAMGYPLTLLQWTVLIANTLFMAYSEGYKGFQLAFSPRLAARCMYLVQNPRPLRVLLAPLFVFGYFDATRRRMIATYALTIMIVFFVIIVHQLSQPWRGIIDAGVVIGLIWGLISMLYFMIMAIRVSDYPYSPEVS